MCRNASAAARLFRRGDMVQVDGASFVIISMWPILDGFPVSIQIASEGITRGWVPATAITAHEARTREV